MNGSQYSELDKLIKEYEEDFRTIRSDRLIMKNFPKVLVMSAASTFEYHIKNRCQDFLDNPQKTIEENYPAIVEMRKKKKPLVDQIFAKLEGYDDDGIENLDAGKFYDLFGGQVFKIEVMTKYSAELNSRISIATEKINGLSSLLGQDEKYDFDYAKQCDLKDELERCTFDDAESSYLGLKLRRNRVAHNYIEGLSDTFEDLQKFYNKAVIYVIALEESIAGLTNPNT